MHSRGFDIHQVIVIREGYGRLSANLSKSGAPLHNIQFITYEKNLSIFHAIIFEILYPLYTILKSFESGKVEANYGA